MNMVAILIMSAKWATLDLLEIKVFWKKGFYFIFVHDVTREILLRDSNYIADVVRWPKFGGFRSFMKEINITSIL